MAKQSLLQLVVDVAGTDTVIASTTSFNMSVNQETIDIETDGDAGWQKLLESSRNVDIDAEMLYDPTDSYNAEELIDQIVNHSGAMKLNIGTLGTTYPVAGKFWEVSGILTSVKLGHKLKGADTVSASWKSSTALVPKAYSSAGSMS